MGDQQGNRGLSFGVLLLQQGDQFFEGVWQAVVLDDEVVEQGTGAGGWEVGFGDRFFRQGLGFGWLGFGEILV